MRKLILVLLLYAYPVFGDCLDLPIIGNGKGQDETKDAAGAFRPKIPPELDPKLAGNYSTMGFPKIVKGKPELPTVVTCFSDDLKIPASLKPMTPEQAAQVARKRNAAVPFSPKALKIPGKNSFQDFLDRAIRLAERILTPALAWAASSTDNFNRSDGDLGTNWDAYDNGAGSPEPCGIISSSVTSGQVTEECFQGYNLFIPGNNQYVQFELPSGFITDSSGHQASALVRAQAPGGLLDLAGYLCRVRSPSQSNTSRIARIDATTQTALASSTATTWGADTVRCEISGTTITLKKNGTTALSASTGGEYTSGRGGIGLMDDPSSPSNPIDNFEVGDLAAAAAIERHRPIVIQ